MVSAYIQFSKPITLYLVRLCEIFHWVPSGCILISADANANSSLWHDTAIDAEGRMLEDFVSTKGILVINGLSEYSTHTGGHNINVTLFGGGIVQAVKYLWVHDSSLSDHKLMTYVLWWGAHTDNNQQAPEWWYNLKRANWMAFNRKLVSLQNWIVKEDTVDQRAIKLTVLHSTAKGTIPRKGRCKPGFVPWWYDEITDARTAMLRACCRYQGCLDDK